MTDIEKNEASEYPKIYSIHSQKGGVGKTSVALALAGFEAIFRDKKVLLIDADLTGTSIGHILESKKAIRKKNYINHLLLADPEVFETYIPIIPDNDEKKSEKFLEDFCREYAIDSHIFYTPSSPEYKDVLDIIPLISQENHLHFFRHRLEDIIVTAIRQKFEAIIIDLPPGFFGLSKSICEMNFEQIVRNLKEKQKQEYEPTRLDYLYNSIRNKSDTNIQGQVVFVSSADKPDYKALIPIFCNFMLKSSVNKSFYYEKMKDEEKKNKLSYTDLMENVNFIFNKFLGTREHPEIITSAIVNDLEKDKGIIEGEIDNYSDIINFLNSKPLKHGAVLFRFISGFDMSEIIKTIRSIKSKLDKKIKRDESSIECWCKNIEKYFNFILM